MKMYQLLIKAKKLLSIFSDIPLRNFLYSHRKLYLILQILAVFIVFLSSLTVFSYIWIVNNYYVDITFDVVLFHLQFPLLGVNNTFVYSYITRALIPAILIAGFFAIKPRVALLVGVILSILLLKVQRIIKVSMVVAWQQHISLYQMLITFIKGGYFKSFWWNEPFSVWFALKALCWIIAICFIVFIIFLLGKKICKVMNLYIQTTLFILAISLNFWILDSHFHLRSYFAPKEYGSFYDENYTIKFLDSNSTAPQSTQNTRNLIVIFAESMESNFATVPLEQSQDLRNNNSNINIIPQLYALANRNINFSTTNGFGGHLQVGRTSWTIAGMVGYMCGIPLNTTSAILAKSFLPRAKCISDILAAQNYNQVMIMGENDEFVAKDAFLRSHHIVSNDAKHYKDIGALPSDYEHQWGFEDSKLFAFAKDELMVLSRKTKESSKKYNTKDKFAPFALYLLTNNTHSPDSFIEPHCQKLESKRKSSLICDDGLIGEFITWVKAQDFYENTSIVIVGDHLMNANLPIPRESRRIYNTFINPKFCDYTNQKMHKNSRPNLSNYTKSRYLSHFDFAPLILDSLGICTESFGLGRNPFLGKTLLETYGTDFEQYINEDSHLYESFWQRQ